MIHISPKKSYHNKVVRNLRTLIIEIMEPIEKDIGQLTREKKQTEKWSQIHADDLMELKSLKRRLKNLNSFIQSLDWDQKL